MIHNSEQQRTETPRPPCDGWTSTKRRHHPKGRKVLTSLNPWVKTPPTVRLHFTPANVKLHVVHILMCFIFKWVQLPLHTLLHDAEAHRAEIFRLSKRRLSHKTFSSDTLWMLGRLKLEWNLDVLCRSSGKSFRAPPAELPTFCVKWKEQEVDQLSCSLLQVHQLFS